LAEAEKTGRLVAVTLDPNTITSIDPDQVHERRVAIYDLLEDNSFVPEKQKRGPFALHLSIVGNHLALEVRDPATYAPIAAHLLSLTSFRRFIRDYHRITESYFDAIRTASTYQIEAVDMGRRGLHNEAAEFLQSRLAGKISVDHATARRLFTLISAIQPHTARHEPDTGARPSILFVCSMNAVRSPMAAALARRFMAGRAITRSAGVHTGRIDNFVHEVMEEVGIDLSVHSPHSLSELIANRFDLVVALSDDAPEAIGKSGFEIRKNEFWPVPDPSRAEGNRDQKRQAYREVRDQLEAMIKERLEPLLA
jgi:uncharacterized protein (UPF0262 family)/protein-tyrosine-phosphatase